MDLQSLIDKEVRTHEQKVKQLISAARLDAMSIFGADVIKAMEDAGTGWVYKSDKEVRLGFIHNLHLLDLVCEHNKKLDVWTFRIFNGTSLMLVTTRLELLTLIDKNTKLEESAK